LSNDSFVHRLNGNRWRLDAQLGERRNYGRAET